MSTGILGTDLRGARARRARQAWLTAFSGIGANAVLVGIRLAVIPLSLRMLGSERYGLWLAVGALVTWMGLAELGLGSGLVNVVSEAYGNDDRIAIRRHISTAALSFAALLLPLLAGALALSRWSGSTALLGSAARPDLAADTRVVLMITGALFALSCALNWVGSFCLALQEGYLGSVATVAGSVATLLCLVALALRGATIAEFSLAMGLPSLLATAALGWYLVRVRHPDLSPRWSYSTSSLRQIMANGGPLFVVQLGDLAVLYSANILIANRLGPGEVPRYAIPFACFSVFSRICWMITSAHWPAYAEAAARQDWEWIRAAGRRTAQISGGLMGVGALAVLLAGPQFIRWWAGVEVLPREALLRWMALYFFIWGWSAANGVLITGLGLIKIRMCLRLAVGVAHVVGGWFLLPTLGLPAIPVAGAVALLADSVVSWVWASAYLRRRERGSASRCRAASNLVSHGPLSG